MLQMAGGGGGQGNHLQVSELKAQHEKGKFHLTTEPLVCCGCPMARVHFPLIISLTQ